MTDGQNDKKFSTQNPEAKCMVCTWLKNNGSNFDLVSKTFASLKEYSNHQFQILHFRINQQ